jgi:hypothetical protein
MSGHAVYGLRIYDAAQQCRLAFPLMAKAP